MYIYATFFCLVLRVARGILLLTALRIAAKLSVLGLPFGDSIRCKLLLAKLTTTWRQSSRKIAEPRFMLGT
jgi:hypothetical protein